MPNFTQIAHPLTRQFKKNAVFVWEDEHRNARQFIIEGLTDAPILAHFDPCAGTELRVDASNKGLGAHLIKIRGTSPTFVMR